MMLPGALLATIPLVVAPAPPPGDPLDAEAVDTSAFPTVVIEFTVPPPLRSSTITADMVELSGGSVASVAPVDPAGIVVGLVIDDGPTVPPEVVEDAQGASVELVRNLSEGTKIALSTPSGLQTALTSDRRASIARIAGITAGAPDVMPLPRLIFGAASGLALSTETDRHLVLVLGSAPTVDVDALAAVVAAAEIEVHLVAPDSVDLGGLAELAVSTGGVVPSMPALVGEIDAATAAIAMRYRVEATVDGAGPRELAIIADDARHAATVDIVAPAPVASTSTTVDATTTTTAATPAPAADAPQTSAPSTSAARSSSGGPSRSVLVVGGLAALAIAGGAVWLVTRRRAGEDELEEAVAVAPRPPVEPEPAAPPVTAPERPARVAAPPRPRRSVSTRRTEPAPAPAPVPSEPVKSEAVGEPDTEWLVSGDLRLRPSTGEVWFGAREVSLTPAELGVLELLMTSGDRGVTPDAIAAAAGRGIDDGEPVDPEAVLTQLRRKARLPGRPRLVRKERVMLYFFDDESDAG